MIDTTASLRRNISSVGDLQSVVRSMKALAASSVGQYEQSVRARLSDAGFPLADLYAVPNSVKAVTSLVGQILVESETRHSQGAMTELYLLGMRAASRRCSAPK